ncbi:Hypothetical_protein [Hexamita inflata]|uniref:Hypothetical_protein n=1 Tax=Hexamita inflata TaxID=28002 RepID=A0AA86PY89_9EUKA|nr:Hypothetical protein HINF_LOCUS36129 [Hexamita inflata]CAI9948494.1 Hypothetical protein HINF_LOCUS36139 [Hexamita inflata]
MAKINTLNVKLTYTLIITLLFSVGLFFSFDVLLTSSQFLPDKFESQLSQSRLSDQIQHAEIRAKTTNIVLDKVYIHEYASCMFDFMDVPRTPNAMFNHYFFTNNKNIEIYSNKDNKYHKIDSVGQQYILNNQKYFINMYKCSLAFSIIGIILPILAIIFIWFFCVDWCVLKIQFNNKNKFMKMNDTYEQEDMIQI